MSHKEERSVTRFLQSIDDDTMKRVMEYFQFEDYDALIRYVHRIGIRIPSQDKDLE